MAFLNNEQATDRLASSRNVAHRIVADSLKEERGLVTIPENLGNKGLVAEILKPVIAAVGIVDGNVASAKEFGVTPATVARYKKDYEAEAEAIITPVRDKALERLSNILTGIVPAPDDSALVRSAIVKNLSQVVKNITPQRNKEASTEVNNGNKYQFNIVVPAVKPLSQYDVIDVVSPAA